MTRLYALESFDDLAGLPPGATVSTTEFEEARLASYESGYAAGWEDAVSAQEDEIGRLRADLGQNLREMALTYAEARNHVLRSLEPLLGEMVSKVLPQMARAALAGIVVETLRPLAAEMAAAPMVVRTHPDNRAAIARMIGQNPDLPITIRDEPSLALGQAFLIAGGQEAAVDLDRAVSDIAKAVQEYFLSDIPEEVTHG